MNERIGLLFSVIAADLAASTFLYTHDPQSPLCVMSSGLVVYAMTHLAMAAVLWAVVFGAGWLLFGPVLLRPRQNDSTKFKFLGIFCGIGLMIDGGVGVYQSSEVPEQVARVSSFGSVGSGLAQREVCYLAAFWAMVLLWHVAARMRQPDVTPPPRFGR